MRLGRIAGATTAAGLVLAGLPTAVATAGGGAASASASVLAARAEASTCDTRGDRATDDDCARHRHRGKAADGAVRTGSRFGLSVRMHPGLRADLAKHVRANRDSLGPRATGLRLQVQYRAESAKRWKVAHSRQWRTGKRGWPQRTARVRVAAPKTAGAYELRVRLVLPKAMRSTRSMAAEQRATRAFSTANYPAALTSGATSLVAYGRETVYQPVVFQISNAQPGQRISLELTGNGVPVGFSTGPDFDDSSGLDLTALSGAVPLQSLDLNPSELAFATTSQAGGGSLTFSIRLFLAGNAGVQLFYLRSSSDPGVEVTASVGNSVPQIVNATQTLFSWDPI